MKKRIFSVLLILTLILASCGETKVSNDQTTSSDESVSVETDYLDTLGEKNFNGASYKILTAEDPNISIMNMQCGEITGEVINDTQYNRDKTIEARYNVVIEYPEFLLDDHSKVSNAALAGDYIADIYIDSLRDGKNGMSSVLSQGGLMNLLDVPYLQLDREWWSSLMYENLKINDKLFYTSGDVAITSFIGPACVYMNTTVAEKYHIDENELYSLVYDGTWTMDKLYSYTKDADNDLNSDGKMDCINDFYGIVNENNNLTSTLLLASSGVHLSDYNNKTGKIEVALGTSEVVDTIENLSKWFKTVNNSGDDVYLFDRNFKSDQSIFALHYVESAIRRFRDMESDYVIYPMPKYDEDQSSYVSFINPWVRGFVAVPLVQENIEKTGFITEVLEYQSVKTLRPAVIDITLKGKALRNDDSIAMLDLIFSTTYIDYNSIYGFGGSAEIINRAIFHGSPYASSYASAKEKIDAELDTFMKTFE